MPRVSPHPRKQSEQTLSLARVLRCPALIISTIKHLVSALFFGGLSFLYSSANVKDLRSVKAFAPTLSSFLLGFFSLLHFFGLYQIYRLRSPKHRVLTIPTFSCGLSRSTELALFHLIEVACQSYQAYHMSFYLVNRSQAFCFTFLVSLYCLLTPWFLFARHRFVRQSLVLILNSSLGFILSTAFPMIVFFTQAMRLVLIDRRMQNDARFIAESLLVGRYLIISSPIDMLTKCLTQLASFLSLQRLIHSMCVAQSPHQLELIPAFPSKPIRENFHLQFQEHRRIWMYLVGNLVWGFLLLLASTTSIWHRATCPSHCYFDTAPWLDLTCNCVYVELNCGFKNISGYSIDSYLEPKSIGYSLFILITHRCHLTKGIPVATLEPFRNLFGIYFYFTNITEWPNDPKHSLPSSLAAFHIRGSNLTSVPEILAYMPPNLIFLRLEGASITDIPDEYYKAWINVSSLSLSDLGLKRLSSVIPNMKSLVSLELRGNEISEITNEWQKDLVQVDTIESIDLGANQLTQVPSELVLGGVSVDISSNPITFIPSSIDSAVILNRQLIVDDTPFCIATNYPGCEIKCSRQCKAKLIGDFRCDFVCFNAPCRYDDGDCHQLGIN